MDSITYQFLSLYKMITYKSITSKFIFDCISIFFRLCPLFIIYRCLLQMKFRRNSLVHCLDLWFPTFCSDGILSRMETGVTCLHIQSWKRCKPCFSLTPIYRTKKGKWKIFIFIKYVIFVWLFYYHIFHFKSSHYFPYT